jgi:uncharacterized protein YndB with AHSA1/START domain
MTNVWKINPKRDLVLERVVDVPVELVWKAWTESKQATSLRFRTVARNKGESFVDGVADLIERDRL